ncbi:uncharacterized protein LOC144445633 isoform X2 [Glandiceps talaboti]
MSCIKDKHLKNKKNEKRMVNQNGKLSDLTFKELEQHIEETVQPLLTDTQCSEWRQCLLHIMQFSLRDRLIAIVKYFQHLISTAVHVHEIDPERPHEIPVDSLDLIKPSTLSVEQWRKLVTSLHLGLEEPDTSFDLRYTTVVVPANVNQASLEGFLSAINAVLEIGNGETQMLCQLSAEVGRNIQKLLHEVLLYQIIELPHRHPILQPVWTKYSRSRDFLESLGIKQIKTEERFRVVRFPQDGQLYERLKVAYFLLTVFFTEVEKTEQKSKTVVVSAL